MPAISPEQLAEFREYEKAHAKKPISSEALKGVVDDDIKEADKLAEARLKHNREYNHTPDPALPRTLTEKD